MASNSTNHINSYWISIEGDFETRVEDKWGSIVDGRQRLQSDEIRLILEKHYKRSISLGAFV